MCHVAEEVFETCAQHHRVNGLQRSKIIVLCDKTPWTKEVCRDINYHPGVLPVESKPGCCTSACCHALMGPHWEKIEKLKQHINNLSDIWTMSHQQNPGAMIDFENKQRTKQKELTKLEKLHPGSTTIDHTACKTHRQQRSDDAAKPNINFFTTWQPIPGEYSAPMDDDSSRKSQSPKPVRGNTQSPMPSSSRALDQAIPTRGSRGSPFKSSAFDLSE